MMYIKWVARRFSYKYIIHLLHDKTRYFYPGRLNQESLAARATAAGKNISRSCIAPAVP